MPIAQADITQTARRLRDAYGGQTIGPLRDVLDPGDIEGAYAVQAENTRVWSEGGREVVGRKIGLTAKAVQKQLGVDQPDFGVLFGDMARADGGTLDPSRFIQPKAEAEIAFVMGRDLPSGADTAEELMAHVGEVACAIEIVDSRITDWKITFADTVADNGSSAAYVLSDDRRTAKGADLWSCGMVMQVNGEVASVGAGAACLGHPANAALWLANTLAERGEPLKAGDVLLTGALGPMVVLKPGDTVKATIGGIGAVSFDVGEAPFNTRESA